MTARKNSRAGPQSTAEPRHLTVTDGRDVVAYLLESPGAVVVRNRAGKTLGTFPNRTAALAALDRSPEQ